MTVDWAKPVETVDGDPVEVVGPRVVRMKPVDRDYIGTWEYDDDGNSNHWLPKIRNVQPATAKPAEIDATFHERLIDIVQRLASPEPGGSDRFRLEAQTILAESFEAVDADVAIAEDLANQFAEKIAGWNDLALAAIKRGRALEREAM